MLKKASQCISTCLIVTAILTAEKVHSCSKMVHIAKAEQTDELGLKCWDTIKVQLCGGECDSSEVNFYLLK